MNIVERLYPGYQWAEPLRKGEELTVEQLDSELHITGLLPGYLDQNHPSDLIRQYELGAKYRAVGKLRTSEESPDIRFANAETDEKLIAFVQRFGPVVAKRAYTNFEKPEQGQSVPLLPPRLFAVQDMEELRNEQVIYRSALTLVMRLNEPKFDYESAQILIRTIAEKITAWSRQWKREKSQRVENLQGKEESYWSLSAESLKRIQQLKSGSPDLLRSPMLDGRIVICELLNSFPQIVFPNPLELHSSIKFGIRPLLYSLLRRQFISSRDFAICANTQCRNFFNIERAGQQFCSPDCSLHQRQRTYWLKRGKKARKKRLRAQRKAKK